MTLSNAGANAVLDAMLNNTSLQFPAYCSLHSADPGATGANELSGNGYTRSAVISFTTPSTGSMTNSAVVTFPTASGNWTQATYFGLWSASSSGTFLAYSTLTNARTVLSGEYAEFAVGAMGISGSAAANCSFGETTANNILAGLFKNTAWVVAQAYFSLHSASPGASGANELAHSNGYERTALSFEAAGAGTNKQCRNDVQTDSPACVTSDWSTATDLGLWTSGTYGGGTFLWAYLLTASRTVKVGKVFRIAVNGVNVTLA